MTDYKILYEQKLAQCQELNEQFNTWQDESSLLINDLQKQNKELRSKVTNLQQQLETLKDKKKSYTFTLEKQLELIKRQKNDFKTKFQDFQRKVVELQNINETLEADNRASKCMLDEYEQRVEKTMQQLALLQIQLQQNKQSNQEQITRLKNQIKQTQQELYVVHLKHQKHNDQSQHRRSRLSSSVSSFSSQQDASKLLMPQDKSQNTNNILNMDFKRNKEASFQKTINLLTNLIGQLDNKAKKIKAKRKIAA